MLSSGAVLKYLRKTAGVTLEELVKRWDVARQKVEQLHFCEIPSPSLEELRKLEEGEYGLGLGFDLKGYALMMRVYKTAVGYGVIFTSSGETWHAEVSDSKGAHVFSVELEVATGRVISFTPSAEP